MNEDSGHPEATNPACDQTARAIPVAPERDVFFQRTDWLSFGATVAVALSVYLFTLASEVTLGFSGIFSAGAMYAGVPHPPGYPLWTIYAWVFTRMLPFSNIAWRVAVSSAVAGALACGVVSLMVSRGGAMIAPGIAGRARLKPKEQVALRVVSGCIAGLAFGFSGGFWRRAVVADPWPLSLLLFAVVLCLLMTWMYSPGRRRYLYAASFVYGLTFSNSQALFAAAFGLEILVMLGDPRLVRECCLANSLLFASGLLADRAGFLEVLDTYSEGFNILRDLFFLVGFGSVLVSIVLVIQTRRFLTEWKAVSVCASMFLFGLASYLYVPIASMANPPVNWAYPRTAQGFIHLLIRGQYERIHATASVAQLSDQLRMYAEIAITDFGALYLLFAIVPFCLLHRMRSSERKWIFGLLAVCLCLVSLLLVVLNPSTDRDSREVCKVFFSASHVVLAVWTGYGFVLFGFLVAGQRSSLPSMPAQDK